MIIQPQKITIIQPQKITINQLQNLMMVQPPKNEQSINPQKTNDQSTPKN